MIYFQSEKNNNFFSKLPWGGGKERESYSIRACFEKGIFITDSLQPFVEQLISGGKQKMSKKTVSMRLF